MNDRSLPFNNLPPLPPKAEVETKETLSAGIRKTPGTSLVNDTTGEVIYTPPDNPDAIQLLLSNLDSFINQDSDIDPLIRMALVHYQFESIHPFYDGNGRTGRIINVLFLVLNNLIESPVLYLSSYINRNKAIYYRLLQDVRDSGDWQGWILFMLKAVEETSKETFMIISAIVELLEKTAAIAREKLPTTSYSRELIEAVFIQPYTKIDFLVKAGIGERRTASKYLKQLQEIGILESRKLGREMLYINTGLYELLKTDQSCSIIDVL